MNYPAQKQPQEKEPAKAHPNKNLPVEPAPSKEDTPALEQPLSQTGEHFKGTACADSEGIKYLEANLPIEAKEYTTVLKYKGSRDGFEAKDFHDRCDGLGPTVSLLITDKLVSIAGFASASW
jgi:hypothetical protein